MGTRALACRVFGWGSDQGRVVLGVPRRLAAHQQVTCTPGTSRHPRYSHGQAILAHRQQPLRS